MPSVLHPILRRMDGQEFARFMHAFLPIARRAPSNYIAIIGMILAAAAAAAALVALGGAGAAGEAPFVLSRRFGRRGWRMT